MEAGIKRRDVEWMGGLIKQGMTLHVGGKEIDLRFETPGNGCEFS